MSELRRKYCIFGCDALVTYGVPLHRFPNPDNRPDLFAAWIAAVGNKVGESDRTKIYKNKRICDHHFDPTFKTTGGHLTCSAMPTVNLNRVQQTISTFVETDHNYCRPRRQSGHAGPLIDITNLPGSSVQTEHLPGPSRSGPSAAVDSTEFSGPSGSTCFTSSEEYHARTPLTKFDPGADQRTYVCGWALTKCLQKVVKGCKNCKSKLLGNSDNEMYRYIRAREYSENKKWLCYPSDCLVACFQEIQETTVAFLNNDCHKKNIKERIKAFIELFTDFSFIDCELHKEKLKECFVDTTIHVIIYSWCRCINRILNGKITYEGEDVTKKAAQIYYNKYKTNKY